MVLQVFLRTIPQRANPSRAGSGWTRNLSHAGACLELSESLAQGTALGLFLQAEDDGVALDADVVWVGPPGSPGGRIPHGVRFLRVASTQQQVLQALLRREGPWRARRYRRCVALPARCQLGRAVEPSLHGWTGDLSLEGCSLLLRDRLPLGTSIEVTLGTPRADISVRATVVWAHSGAEAVAGQITRHGVRFGEINPLQKVIVLYLLEELPDGSGRPG